MNSDEFIKWLSAQLLCVNQFPINANLIEASHDLVNGAIEKLSSLASLEQEKVIETIIKCHQSGSIGDYQIPYDDRDKFDTIEAILGTIEGFLEG